MLTGIRDVTLAAVLMLCLPLIVHTAEIKEGVGLRVLSSFYTQMWRTDTSLYSRSGGGGGGRGFNVAALDGATGTLLKVNNFDTWRYGETEADKFLAFLDAWPLGTVLLLSTGDEAGLNSGQGCTFRDSAYVDRILTALADLGSSYIQDYCWRSSWAMIVTKGHAVHAEEIARRWNLVTARADLPFAAANAGGYLQHLRTVMDRYHQELGVYEDIGSPGNHFHVHAKWPNVNAGATCTGFATDQVYSGATSLKCSFTPGHANDYGGIIFQNGILRGDAQEPIINPGTEPNAGIDLRGATALRFRARGLHGGEKIDFFVGGVGWAGNRRVAPYPDSSAAKHLKLTLKSQWTEYRIDLTGRDMSYVLGGLGWGANASENPNGATFYLDDIAYELSVGARGQRLEQPRFLRSFETKPTQPAPAESDGIDSVMRNLAFTYDNALVVLAFLADDSDVSLSRARLVGDAFVYASYHDRSFNDGRLRSAYAAGDLALPPGWTPNGRSGTAATPGYYDQGVNGQPDIWLELESQNIDVGNNAWAMLALLALYERTDDARYLYPAERIATFITNNFRANTGTYQGFTGGFNYPENTPPTRRVWASTEHNLDLAAGLQRLAMATGNLSWLSHGKHAEAFVNAMRDTETRCHYAGTKDAEVRNENDNQLPVDTQSWGVLALPDATPIHQGLLDCAIAFHQTEDNGFSGFDFNNDRDGVWFEGTAQMALAFALGNRQARRNAVIQTLRRAQNTKPYGNGQGIAAASHDRLSTGFHTVPGGDKFEYFRRLHIGATAWAFMAEVGYNPFVEPGMTTLEILNQMPSRGGWRSILK